MIDLTPTTARTAAIVTGVRDDQLDALTPMDRPVRVVVHHVLGLATAFRDAAAKATGPTTDTAPELTDEPLPDDWRSQVESRLASLAATWQAPDAWEGMTQVGGVELPGEVCGLVGLNEVLLHGWDVTRATGQDYAPTDAECAAVLPMVTPAPDAPDGAGRDGLFGTVVDVPDDAPFFDRVLGLAGRDPAWSRG